MQLLGSCKEKLLRGRRRQGICLNAKSQPIKLRKFIISKPNSGNLKENK